MTVGITDAQLTALGVLGHFAGPTAYLAGGVGVALRMGHRLSRDLDLFTPEVDVERLAEDVVTGQSGAKILSRAAGTLYLDIAGVPASILRYSYPLLGEPERITGIPVRVASLPDLSCMKLSAVAGRGARRDFWDLSVLLERLGWSLPFALEQYQRKYTSEDVGHVVRSLVYFTDAEAEPWPTELSRQEWQRIKEDFIARVRAL
jgi:hypothetical protein